MNLKRTTAVGPMSIGLAAAISATGGTVAAVLTWQWWWALVGWTGFFAIANLAASVNIYRDAKAKR